MGVERSVISLPGGIDDDFELSANLTDFKESFSSNEIINQL